MQIVKIKSIKKIAKEDRYDLTVSATNNFFANGILIHNSSGILANVLVKRQLKWYEKLAKRIGVNVNETEYDYLISSRRVIKNEYEDQVNQHFYDSDIWQLSADKIKNKIPHGFTCYFEICGYTPTSQYIQPKYDYGCNKSESKIFIYRITSTNVDGFTIELDDFQIKQFCEKYDLNYLNTKFYYGYAKDLYSELDSENHWHENFIANLERDYNDKECFMCINKVWEEGIVLRKQDLFNFEAYKLKSGKFLEAESKQLDDENLEVME